MSATTVAATASTFRQDIQGLRAIAVLLVVLYHARFGWLHGGYVGVDVFFVISGYLITGLLLKELEKTGSVDLGGFYARRMRRLLPAAMLVLVATTSVAYALYSPLELQRFSSSALATAGYVSNLWFAHLSTDYLADETGANPLLHTWSLSVEEQFYLVWPAFLLLMSKAGPACSLRQRLLWGFVALFACSLVASVLLTEHNQPWAFFGSPTRGWEFGAGGLIALWRPRTVPNQSRLLWLAGTVGLLLILTSALLFTKHTSFPGIAAVVPVSGAALLILAAHGRPAAGVNRWLGAKPLSFLGDISYSLYLWHWPIFVFMSVTIHDIGLPEKLAGLAVALGLAWLTYIFVENPVRFSPLLLRRVRVSIAAGLMLSASSAGYALIVREASALALKTETQQRYLAAGTDKPHIYTNGCHAEFFDTEAPECEFGDRASQFTVVLFGDSHAAQWFPALERIAEHENWRLVPLTKSACPSVSFQAYNRKLGRRYTECDQWRSWALGRIRALGPKIVIVANTSRHVPRDNDPTSDEKKAEWAAAVGNTISDLEQLASTIVLISETPWLSFDAPTCLSRAAWKGRTPSLECTFDPSSAHEAAVARLEAAAVAGSNRAFLVDMTGAICIGPPCPVERGAMVLYRDRHHLTVSFSQHLANELRTRLQPAVELSSK